MVSIASISNVGNDLTLASISLVPLISDEAHHISLSISVLGKIVDMVIVSQLFLWILLVNVIVTDFYFLLQFVKVLVKFVVQVDWGKMLPVEVGKTD